MAHGVSHRRQAIPDIVMPQPRSPPLLDTITKIGKAEAVACIRADAYHDARVARRAAPDTIAVKPLRSRISVSARSR